MSVEVLMPALSPTMTEGKLAKWLIREGDKVSAGDIIAEIETDKATMEVEAVEEGVVGKIVVTEGMEGIAVNSVIAILLVDGEDMPAEGVAANNNLNAPTDADEKAATEIENSVQIAQDNADDMSFLTSTSYVPVEIGHDPQLPEATAMVEQTVREALRDAMAEEMRSNKDVLVLGEEVAEYQGAYKVTQGLLDEFGSRRVVDTPITEHGFAGMAVGMAFDGLRPVVEFMTFNFAMQAIDHLINSAAKTLYMAGGKLGCPIVFRGPNGAAARVGAQHSQDYSSWYAHVPGMKVVAPYSADDAKGLLKAAIRDPNPVVFLENEILYGHSFPVPDIEDYVLPIGRARVRRTGSDVTIVTYSIGNVYALQAAEVLAQEGLEVEIIDLRSLRPLDMESVIASVKKTNRCVTVENGWPVCSIGSEISARLMEHAFDYLDAPVLRVTGKDVPMPYAANLEKMALPTVKDVIQACKVVSYRQ